MRNNAAEYLRSALAVAILGLTACGGGGGGGGGEIGGPDTPVPPIAPTPPVVAATPGNAQAALAWAAMPTATSYNVYTSSTSPVSKAGTKTTVSTAGTAVSGLTNGTPTFAAVATVGPGGESALSNEVCAVPTAASSAGVTLYDALCSSTLDGTKWQTPLFSRGVVNGAMVLSTQAVNMEPYGSRGVSYTTVLPVNFSGQRVTALQANLNVPAATASRTGAAVLSANVRLLYQPPAGRLFPVDGSDVLAFQVGFRDDGNGPRVFREISHCDNVTCTTASSNGISFADPAGFSGEAVAAYDTTYLVTAALNEATGVFTWTISGGSLNLSGTADPAAYLAGNAKWAAVGANPLIIGFTNAGPRTRVIDNAGGSSGAISARFDDFKVGFNNAGPTAWDDFSAASGNSGPTELSAAKWTLGPGMNSMTLAAGSLAGHAQVTAPSTASLQVFNSIGFSDPTAVNTIQADFTVTACSNSLGGTNRVGFAAAIYNDGTPGTTPPDINQPNSRVGDITASLFLDCTFGDVRFQLTRFDTNGAQTIISDPSNPIIPKAPAAVVGNTHTLRMKWDPTAHLLTLQADGQAAVVVDPTTVNSRMRNAAPYVKPANVLNTNLSWFVFLPSTLSAGATASVDFKANNVFTAP